MNRVRAGIVLLNMGSPGSPEETRAFLFRLFSDPDMVRLPGGPVLRPLLAGLISALRAPRVARRYRDIGGISPLLEITRNQARALEGALRERGAGLPVEVGMRYSRPFAREALQSLIRRGAETIVALPLYPQFSVGTTASSLRDVEEAVRRVCPGTGLHEIRDWHAEPWFLRALAQRTLSRLKQAGDGGRTGVLFVAHSIPTRFQEEGDPYIGQVEATVGGVTKMLAEEGMGTVPCFLAYQGQVGPVSWVGPTVPEALQRIVTEGILEIVVVPVSFVSDHLETLYEIDLEYRREAEGLGVRRFDRIAPLNADPDFVGGLAGLVLQRVAGLGKRVA